MMSFLKTECRVVAKMISTLATFNKFQRKTQHSSNYWWNAPKQKVTAGTLNMTDSSLSVVTSVLYSLLMGADSTAPRPITRNVTHSRLKITSEWVN